MDHLAVYALLAFGIWLIVGYATISKWPRERLNATGYVGKFLVDLLQCPFCFGCWEGVVAAYLGWAPTIINVGSRFLLLLLVGILTAATNAVLSGISGTR